MGSASPRVFEEARHRRCETSVPCTMSEGKEPAGRGIEMTLGQEEPCTKRARKMWPEHVSDATDD